MARRRFLRSRSPAEWGVRILLAAVTTLLGYGAVMQSLAYSLRGSDPERAHMLAPWDGRVTALLSEKLSGADAGAAQRTASDRIARQALRQDPTAVAAVATLGLNAQIRGDTTAARHLFAYSATLTRRDLRSELWAIENAVARGDVAGALRNYDIALRTSRIAPDLLFPVMAGALVEPSIRAGLVRTLSGRPPWGANFTDFVANNDPNPQATADLFGRLRRLGFPISEGAQATLIGSLVASGAFDEAWTYYATLRPGVNRRISRDPHFSMDSSAPSSFDWSPINDGGVSTSIQRGNRGGVFDFSVPSSVGGPLLSQMQMLSPGQYTLEGHSTGVEQPESSRPYWVLSCRDGREFGRVALPNSTQANGLFTGRFTLPAGCPVQYLSLVARPSDLVAGVTGQIDRIWLHPIP